MLSERDFRLISDLVYKHCGINLHDGKRELVRARLSKRLRQCGLTSFPQYIDYVMNDRTGREFSRLVDSLSTNLTSFFREMRHFDFLSNRFLPQLMEKKTKQRNLRLRAWSAGCSSGEEPYSIAITLLDETAGSGNWNIKILATDISTAVLETARNGIYPKDRVAPVSPVQKNKYLSKRTHNGNVLFEVNRCLRDIIVFRNLNLMEDWPIKPPLDFIFCRNVMIYFDKPTQQRLIERYWQILDVGGVLFTGHSESLTGIEHKFQYVEPTIYLKA